ncbi:hypothetical protein NMY22_g12624 [Coprinellus aureogranulatus]|nr:hypothetical protein NMY22_g12624 [Coprinellus aureogranulatus]
MNYTFATLADLPVELLLKILSEDDEFSTKLAAFSLRQVCRSLNEILKHRIATRIRIGTDLVKIEELVSSPNTFDTSCKALHLEGHSYPISNPLWGILSGIVGKMRALREVRWVVCGHLNEEVLNAICHITHLEILELRLLQSQSRVSRHRSTGVAEPSLPRLKTLSLDLTYLEDTTGSVQPSIEAHDAAVNIIYYLVAKAPALQQLEIRPSVPDTQLIYLGDAFTHHWKKSSWPTVYSLAACSITFPPSPTWASFLVSLSSLEIPNIREADQHLWTALLSSGVKLATIKVERLSVPLMDYLKGYQGLRSFQFVSNTSFGDPDTLSNFLQHGLPVHHKTLEDLRLWPACDVTDPGGKDPVLVGLSRALSHNFLSTMRILRLDLPYTIPVTFPSTRRIETTLDLVATHFSHLQTLCLHMLFKKLPADTPCFNSGDPLRSFLDTILRFRGRYRRPAPNWQDQRIVVSAEYEYRTSVPGIPFRVNRVVHRIVYSGKRHRLEVDIIATELLSDEGDRYFEEATSFSRPRVISPGTSDQA